jgi:hypothetical protein
MSAAAVIPWFVIATIPMIGLEQERNAWNVAVAALPRHLPNHDRGLADWCDEDLADPIGTAVPRDWRGRGNSNVNSTGIARPPGKIKAAKLASGGMLHRPARITRC